MIKKFISLTKPGIVGGNTIVAAGGFLLASEGSVAWLVFIETLFGLALIMAAGCVFNNYIDREIDGKMERTKQRELVQGLISTKSVFIFGSMLLFFGILTLALYSNFLALGVAMVGFFVYVVVYSMWAKRRTMYATEIGSIAGAVPPVVGYCAASNSLDLGALMLFLILCFWQMPHFFAIALRRMDEYAAASVPVLPIVKGIRATKIRSALYMALFSISVVLLWVLGYVGRAYLVVMIPACLVWLGLCVRGFWETDTKRWARSMFLCSLVVLLLFALMISIDAAVDPVDTIVRQ